MRDVRDGLQIEHVATGIAQRLAEKRFGRRAHSRPPGIRVVRVYQRDVQREFGHRVLELGDGPTVDGL